MPANVLCIVPSRELLDGLRASISPGWPDAALEYYQPDEVGEPIDEFPWEHFDLIFLNDALNFGAAKPLDWLATLRGFDGCPPVVWLGEALDGQREALKRGAATAISVRDIVGAPFHQLLAAAIDSAPLERLCMMAGCETAEVHLAFPEESAREVLSSPAFLRQALNAHASVRREATQAMPHYATVGTNLGDDDDAGVVTLDGNVLDVPGYRIVRPLGQGGMATVFLAERQEDNLSVVLKIMPVGDNEDRDILRRFLREYNLIGSVQHPNVVRIYERAFATDYAYIALEYFDAGDLKQRLVPGEGLPEATRYLGDIARGLHAAHERNIVHRDVKPANVLFRGDDTLAITDFGVSSKLAGPHQTIARSGQIVGTPHYLSPEQINGKKATVRSDLYSLGVLLFEMLTGIRPFNGKRLTDVLHAHLNDPVPTLPSQHAALQPILERMLAKDPDQRFQSAEELLAALDELGRGA